jgi:hypothetical protein
MSNETTIIDELASIREELRKLRLEITRTQRDSGKLQNIFRRFLDELREAEREAELEELRGWLR